MSARLPSSAIPEPWATQSESPAMEWLFATGTVEQALAYSELLWPDFVEHQDCILLHCVADSFPTWKDQLGDLSKVEAMLNHVHISDFFHRESSHDLMISLGHVLKDAWTMKLARDFPGRRFCIEFYDERSEDPTDYQITFYQMRQDI